MRVARAVADAKKKNVIKMLDARKANKGEEASTNPMYTDEDEVAGEGEGVDVETGEL